MTGIIEQVYIYQATSRLPAAPGEGKHQKHTLALLIAAKHLLTVTEHPVC